MNAFHHVHVSFGCCFCGEGSGEISPNALCFHWGVTYIYADFKCVIWWGLTHVRPRTTTLRRRRALSSLKSFPIFSGQSLPPVPPPPPRHPLFWSLSVPEFHQNETTLHVLFCVWLLSFHLLYYTFWCSVMVTIHLPFYLECLWGTVRPNSFECYLSIATVRTVGPNPGCTGPNID